MEKGLFNPAMFDRLIENKTVDGLLNDLSDTKYKQFLNLNKEDFSMGLRKYILSIYLDFRKRISLPGILDIFMINEDVINLINYVKNPDLKGIFLPGVFAINWQDEKHWPGLFHTIERKIVKILNGKPLSEAYDNLIEKVCMDIVYEKWVKHIRDVLILNYWNYMIDIKNMLINLNHLGVYHPAPVFYFSGGHIEEGFWKHAKVVENIPDKLKIQPFMKYVLGEKEYISWEEKLARFLGKLLREMRRITFGPAPVVSYFLSSLEEIKNLNLIHTGINLELKKEQLKQRLNLAYVG